jgi:DNA invertase Pin-like site-specific DNA recombinase
MIPAAQYLRTSRSFQESYLEHQRDVIGEFARVHGFTVVKTYEDLARSGLVLRQRPGMQSLINDVLGGATEFQFILTYDVSRWGRFQDVDEAAHYEFLCKSSGIPVLYCNEPYVNTPTAAGAMFKNIKRSQAGEFSRELSEKVFRASRYVAELGFRVGGTAGYGFRRVMVSPDGRHLHQFSKGEYKYSKRNRTILIPGPEEEVAIIRDIFSMADTKGMGCQEITLELSRRGILFHTGKPWDYGDVFRTLTNPKYMGANVWGRTSTRLKSRKREILPENWIVKSDAFVPIIDAQVYDRVQDCLRRRRRSEWTDAGLLHRLKFLLTCKGYINQDLIDLAPGLPSSATYYAHFGPLRRLYRLIGYRPQRGTFTKIFRRDQNEKLRARLLGQIQKLFPDDISVFRIRNKRRLILRLDNGLSVSVVLCRSLKRASGEIGWKLYPTRTEREYITLLCRLTPNNNDFLDFYLFPFIEKRSWYAFTSKDSWFRTGKRLIRLHDLCREAKLTSMLDEHSSAIRTRMGGGARVMCHRILSRDLVNIAKTDAARSAGPSSRQGHVLTAAGLQGHPPSARRIS